MNPLSHLHRYFEALERCPTLRWNGFVTGTPTVPPPVAFISGIKMLCIPTVTCNWGVSNPVNFTNSFDNYNDPSTESVMIASCKAAGANGPCFLSVNSLLIVDFDELQAPAVVYFGWGDAPVSGSVAGSISTLPDWYVGAMPDTPPSKTPFP